MCHKSLLTSLSLLWCRAVLCRRLWRTSVGTHARRLSPLQILARTRLLKYKPQLGLPLSVSKSGMVHEL